MFASLLVGGTGIEAQEVNNEVEVTFHTVCSYSLSGDNFSQEAVDGYQKWETYLYNSIDNTHQEVTGANVSLNSDVSFAYMEPGPDEVNPPDYSWNFSDNISEDNEIDETTITVSRDGTVDFNPGFNISRAVDQPTFTGDGEQILNVHLKRVGSVEQFHINIDLPWQPPSLTSVFDTDYLPEVENHIEYTSDNRGLNITIPDAGSDPLGVWDYEVKINVDIEEGQETEYMPNVLVENKTFSPHPTPVGSSISYDFPGLGTWTWSSTGDYAWNTTVHESRVVELEGFAGPFAEPSLGAITPSLDFNQILSIHDVKIQFTPKRSNFPIRFIVTGENSKSATVLTNNDGIASYSYQGINLGKDEIDAFADLNGNGSWDTGEPQAKSKAIKYWVQSGMGPVTPGGTEFNKVGFDRTVSVNIGIQEAGIPVSFASDNPPPSDPSGDMLLGTATTDGNGDAQFTYHSDFQRIDSIYAYIDANENVNWDDPDEPRSDPPNTVKVWLENSVTGGGKINDADGEVIWTFNGDVSIDDNQIIGNFQLVDHVGSRPGYTGETPVSYYCEDFLSMNTPGFDLAESPGASHNTIVFTGNFTNDKNDETVVLTITIRDLGDPGAGIDMIGVKTGMQPPDPESIAWIGTIPDTPPPQIIPEIISSGNFQLHNLVKHHLPSPNAFMKGITFSDWASWGTPPEQWGLYRPPEANPSLSRLAQTGANWIGLIVVARQETIASTKIVATQPCTATDSELRYVVDLAHSLGIRVMLRAGVGLYNDPNHWSNDIGSAFTSETQWQEWFASYRDYINHFATFSQEAGVDMLCIGIEMGGVTHREQDWRRIIQEVRERFKGPITYSSLSSSAGASTPFPHGEENRITWWDAVDFIGVSGYYQLTDKEDPTVAEIKAAWTDRGHIALLENLSKRFNKPIIFTEIGYPSCDGGNKMPAGGQTEAPLDLQEQADCYQAAMEVMFEKSWFRGMFWFQWPAKLWKSGPEDTSLKPNGKPAEEVLKRFYLSQ